jgi:FixJ family two-component response regulator
MSAPTVISIIDDDPWARQGINDLVVSIGYRTATFSSAEEFLQSGSIENTACVIADLQMPGLSGLDLQDWLIQRGHRISFILVTAYPEDKFRARAMAAGAIGCLSKPFDDQSLIRFLAEAIGQPN